MAVSHGCATWVHRGCVSYEDDMWVVALRYAAGPVAVIDGCALGIRNDSPSVSSSVEVDSEFQAALTCMVHAFIFCNSTPQKKPVKQSSVLGQTQLAQ